eukprot:COSAG02_NODE_3055_length_7457_cov_4.988312_1_plen_667_part_00
MQSNTPVVPSHSSLGNADWSPDCSDGSDEGLDLCVGATSPETGMAFERYSCYAGGIGCAQCVDAASCIAADCAFSNGECGRRSAGAPQRSTDLACLIPPAVMQECLADYCTRSCKAALDAWPWDNAKHGPDGTCQFISLGVPFGDVQAVRSYQTQCAQRVGCPGESPRELVLGLEDSFGDGWNGHSIFVKQTDASGSEQVLATETLDSGHSVEIPLCIQQLADGGFGCLTVEVDSSTECASANGGATCWSEEVGWSLHEVDPLTGDATLLVEAYSATGVPGQAWTNNDDACPQAAAASAGGVNTVASEQGTCAAGERMCASGSGCIPEQYLCDGDIAFGNANWGPDCADGSDEVWQWCAHPDRTEAEIPAGLHHYHNNLERQCASAESTFTCDSVTGCAVSGCGGCAHCDDTTADCLLGPLACIAAGCVWDTDECRLPTSSDPQLSTDCQGLELAASCSHDSTFCPEDCFDSIGAIPNSCLGTTGEFVSLGASAAWSQQVETLKAGRCANRGCGGAVLSCHHPTGPIMCVDATTGGGATPAELADCSTWTGQGGGWMASDEPCGGAITTRTQLRLQLLDSYGDGWNMEPGCTDPSNGCNVYTISTLDTQSVLTTVTDTLEYSANLQAFDDEVNMCVDSAGILLYRSCLHCLHQNDTLFSCFPLPAR